MIKSINNCTGVLGVESTAEGLNAKLRGKVRSARFWVPGSHGTSGTMYTVRRSNSSSLILVTSYAPGPPVAASPAAPPGLLVRPGTVVLATSSFDDWKQ